MTTLEIHKQKQTPHFIKSLLLLSMSFLMIGCGVVNLAEKFPQKTDEAVDADAPEAATNLSWAEGSKAVDTSVTLNWEVSAKEGLIKQSVLFYEDAACEKASGEAVEVNSVDGQSLVKMDLIPGVTYTYQVVTIDQKGNKSVSKCSQPLSTLEKVEVTSSDSSVAKSSVGQLTATGIFSDESNQDLTSLITWTSSDSAIVSVNSAGAFTGVSVGSAVITATRGQVTGEITITVTPAILVSIAVTPTNPSIALGTTTQFVATGTYNDNSTQDITSSAVWASANTSKATVGNAGGNKGFGASMGVGSSVITATIGAISGNTTLTVTAAELVSIEVTPTNASIALGTTQQMTATGVFTDATHQDLTSLVTWSSSDASKASVSNAGGSKGLATSVATGSSTITATSGAISGNTSLSVTAAELVSIAVTPSNSSIAKGTLQQLVATGTYTNATTQDLSNSVTWSSSDAGVAIVSNAGGSKGLVSSVAVGAATMTATLGAISGSTTQSVTAAELVSIEITPSNPTIAMGFNQQFTATGTYTDSSTQNITSLVTWISPDTSIATLSNAGGSEGLATSAGVGVIKVEAVLDSISSFSDFTITAAELVSITLSPENQVILGGEQIKYSATGTYSDASQLIITEDVTWDSSDTNTATISNAGGSNGIATGSKAGTTTISATLGSVSASTNLDVSAK